MCVASCTQTSIRSGRRWSGSLRSRPFWAKEIALARCYLSFRKGNASQVSKIRHQGNITTFTFPLIVPISLIQPARLAWPLPLFQLRMRCCARDPFPDPSLCPCPGPLLHPLAQSVAPCSISYLCSFTPCRSVSSHKCTFLLHMSNTSTELLVWLVVLSL